MCGGGRARFAFNRLALQFRNRRLTKSATGQRVRKKHDGVTMQADGSVLIRLKDKAGTVLKDQRIKKSDVHKVKKARILVEQRGLLVLTQLLTIEGRLCDAQTHATKSGWSSVASLTVARRLGRA